MPINTPETDQAIAAQETARQGDFSAKNLPSPGSLPLPQTPVFGTGEFYQNGNTQQGNTPVSGTNVDLNFLNKVLGTKQQPYKVGNLPTFSQQEVYNPRYSSFLPGADNEERAAAGQSTWDKWGNALVKFAATTVGTFYNGMTAIPSAINYAKGQNVYSDENSNSIDTWLKNLEDKFPNYYSKWEQDHPFMSALPFSGGFADFWGDKMLKNLGFTVGAIASAAVTDFAVGSITGGIGDIPLIGNQVGKLALRLNKIFGTGNIAALGLEVGADAKSILTSANIERVSGLSKLLNGTRYAVNSYAAAASEAGFEARDGYNTVKNDLVTAYQREKGYEAMGQDLDDIEKAARASANTRFGINLVLLGVSNAIQFDNLLKPWSVAKAGWRSSIELGEAGAIGIKKGSMGLVEAIPKSKLGRIYDKATPYIADILSEGVYEEGGQYAAQVGTQNYYDRKYISEHKLDKSGYTQDQSEFDSRFPINNILHSTIEGMKAEFGTTEGLENIFLGALTGIVSKGGKALHDRLTGQGVTGEQERDRLLENLNFTKLTDILRPFVNRVGATGTLQDQYDSTTKSHRIAEDMKNAVKTGDIFQYKNYQHEQFVNFVTSALKAGRFDVRLEQLNMLKDMDQDAFKQAFGMDKVDENVKTVGQYVDLMKQKAESIKKTYNLINNTFSNPFVRTKGITDEEQTRETENYITFENWKEDLTYVASIQDNVKERQSSINNSVKQLDPRIDMNVLRTLTDRKSLVEYSKTLQEQADSLSKAAEMNDSPTQKQDAAEAANLKTKVESINAILADPKFSNKTYEKLFGDLLDHNVNGYNPNATPSPAYSIPPQAIPSLIQFGVDSNKLSAYSQRAKDEFEALASQRGAEKYFQDVEDGKRKWNDLNKKYFEENGDINPIPPTPPPTPTSEEKPEGTTDQTTQKNPTPPPTPVQTVKVSSKDGKISKTFEQGKFYTFDVGNGVIKSAQVTKVEGDNVTITLEDGQVYTLTTDQILAPNPVADSIDDAVTETGSTDEVPPPDDADNDQYPTSEEERGAAKDISTATFQSTDPEYYNFNTPFKNFQIRHQTFLWNLQSYDNDQMDQKNKNNIRGIFVNENTAKKLGFTTGEGNWLDNTKFKGVDREHLRVVYVIQENGNTFYTDINGKKLGNILDGNPDPNQIIYTNMSDTDLLYPDGKPRYINKLELDEKEVMNKWREKRRKLLAINEIAHIPIFEFSVSRGIINDQQKVKDWNQRNSVLKVGLIKPEDLDRPIISISTGNIVVPGSSGQITSTLDGIAYKSGRVLLTPGLTVSWLNSRKINEEEANNIYDVIHEILAGTNTEKGKALSYIRGLISVSPRVAANSSITLSGMNLYLGKDKVPIVMFKAEIEKNKDRIIEFLKNAYHNVDKPKLNQIAKEGEANREFYTVKVKDGKLVTDQTYKNYNHYLLSDSHNGKERTDTPLTTNIRVPVSEIHGIKEIPFIQKYIQVKGDDWDSSQFTVKAPQTPDNSTKPATPPPPPTPEKAQEQGIKKEVIPKEVQTIADEAGIKQVSGNIYNLGGITGYIGDEVFDSRGNVTDFTVIAVKFPNGAIAKAVGDAQIKGLINSAIQKSQITQDETNAPKATKVAVKSTSTPEEVASILNQINENQKKVQGKTEDSDFYIINGEKYKRVTNVIGSDFYGEKSKYDDARAAGHTIDTIVRDFFANGTVTKPEGITQEAFDRLTKSLAEVKKNITEKGERFLTNNIILFDEKSKVAGEVDILSVDKDGNFNIYDTKTSKDFGKYDVSYAGGKTKRASHSQQLSVYANLFQNQYGKPIHKLGILPIEIVYDSHGNISFANKLPGINVAYDPEVSKIVPLTNSGKTVETKPETALERAERLEREGKVGEGGAGEQYKTAFTTGTYEKIDIDAEYAGFRAIVGDRYTLNKVDHLLRKTNGGFAWGAVMGAMLYVYNESPTGTLYHEAFEGVWGNFLTGKEQQELYDEFKQREGSFIDTSTGEKITKKYSEATLLEAKEKLADEFAEFRRNKVIAGQTKSSPKVLNFFQRLVNFIQRIIFGKKADRNSLFKKMNQGYYRNYANNVKDIHQAEYSTARHEQLASLPEYMIQDTIQGMTINMMQQLFKEGSDVVTMLDERPKQASKVIYKNLLDRLTDYYEGTSGTSLMREVLNRKNDLKSKGLDADITALNQQYEDILKQWDNIRNNWEGFVHEHKKYLRTFSIEFEVDDNGNVEKASNNEIGATVDEKENKSQSSYTENYMTTDAKKHTAGSIRLLIASIADSVWKDATASALGSITSTETIMKKDNSSVGMPKVVQYAKLFNYILHSSANIGNIYDVLKILQERNLDEKERKDTDANVQRFLEKLDGKQNFLGKSWAQGQLLIKAEQAIVKNKPDYVRQFIDKNGHIYMKGSVLNSKLDQLKSGYIAGIKASDIIVPGGVSTDYILVNNKVITKKTGTDFLNLIGIPITKNEYKRLRGNEKDKFDKAVHALKGVLIEAERSEQPLEVISSNQSSFNGHLTTIADIYVNNISGDDTQSQHPNLDGEQTSSFITNNFVMTVLNDANNSKNKQEFLDKIGNEYLNDMFQRDSYLLNNVMFKASDGTANKIVPFTVMEGLQKWDNNNTSNAKSSEVIRSLTEINANNQGIFYTLLPADAVTENAISSGTFLNADKFFQGEVGFENPEFRRFVDQMFTWLQTEIALAKDYNTNPNRRNIAALDRENPVDKSRKLGNSLRFFQDILTKEIVNNINKGIIDAEGEPTYTIDRNHFDYLMYDMIAQKANNRVRYFEEWEAFTNVGNGQLRVSGLEKTFLSHIGESANEIYSRESIVRLMAFREMNYVISNIDMHKMFFGDPAQYKDELKRIKSFLSGRDYTHVDTLGTPEGFNAFATQDRNWAGHFTDRNKMVALKPGDPGYKVYSNQMNTFTLYDVYTSSRNGRKDYKENNVADAAAYIMPTAYRELMQKSGRWRTRDEEQFQIDNAWTRLEMERDKLYNYTDGELKKMDQELVKEADNPNVAYQSLKIIHSGMQYNNGVAIASLDKASWTMLNYRWFKGKNLGHLYVEMLNKNIDYVRMQSAHKTGIQNQSATDLYDEKGNFNKAGIQGIEAEQVQLKHLGIQVEQAKKETGQTEGSQARKIVTMDLLSNNIPKDYKGTPESWAEMTEEKKEKASKVYAKVKRFDRAMSRSVNIRTESMMKKLGIVPEGNSYTIEDKKKLSDYIFRELERRELPRNIAYGLEINPFTGDFNIPIEANTQYTKIRQIIYNIIEATVQRPKFNGGQKTMVSVLGMESGPLEITEHKVNGKTVYVSPLLNTYEEGEGGKSTTACEIMLPYYFLKKMMAAQKAGATVRTKEEVLKYLQTAAGKELLKGIGFRIPTQGLNSLDFFVVKDFLPENMGDTVVFPAEITTKAGSDFDIDKMNIYLKNFYIDSVSGYPTLITSKSANIDTNSEDALRDYYNKYMLDDFKVYKEYTDRQDSDKRLNEAITRLAEKKNITLEEEEEEEEPEYVPTLEEFISENLGKPQADVSTLAMAENEYIDAMADLLSDPLNYDSLTKPNSAEDLKTLRNRIVDLVQQKEENLIKNQPYGKMLDSTFMMQERQAYLSTKDVVAIAATANTFHALSQRIPNGLIYRGRKNFMIRAPHNEYNGEVSLSGITIAGYSDVYISNIISQIIDGGVDVTKDKFLAEMGINKDTLPVVLALVRAGVSARWAITFINQPMIKEFIRKKAINTSIPIIDQYTKKLNSKYDIKANLLNDPRFSQPNDRVANHPPLLYSIEEMEQMIKADNLNPSQRGQQINMLNDFFSYQAMADDLYSFYAGYSWDTGNIGDPNITRLKELAYLKARTLPMTDVRELVNNSFLGTMRKSIWKFDNAFKSVIRVQRGVAGNFLTKLSLLVNSLYRAKVKTKQNILLKAEISMIDYAIQNSSKATGRPLIEHMPDLMMGHRSVAHYVKAMQSSNVKGIRDNPFVKNLLAKPTGVEGFPSTVQLIDRDYDTYTSNVWTDSWRALKNDTTLIFADEFDEENPNGGKTVSQIAEDLAVLSILQYGGRRTSNSMTHLIPGEMYAKYANPALQLMNLENFDEVGSFYRNNMGDPWIVPQVSEDVHDWESDSHDFQSALTPEFMRIFKETKGEDSKLPFLYYFSDSNSGLKPFVKKYNEGSKKMELFQLVQVEGLLKKEPFRLNKGDKRAVYKQVNIWGEYNRVQEHHQYGRPSILTGINPPVVEFEDGYLIDMFRKSGINVITEPSTSSQVTELSKESVPTPEQIQAESTNTPDDQEGELPENDTPDITDTKKGRDYVDKTMNPYGSKGEPDSTNENFGKIKPKVNKTDFTNVNKARNFDEAAKIVANQMLSDYLDKNPMYYLPGADKMKEDDVTKIYEKGKSGLTRITPQNVEDAKRIDNKIGDSILNNKNETDIIPDFYEDAEIEVPISRGVSTSVYGLKNLLGDYNEELNSEFNPNQSYLDAYKTFAAKNGLGKYFDIENAYNPNQLRMFDEPDIDLNECPF